MNFLRVKGIKQKMTSVFYDVMQGKINKPYIMRVIAFQKLVSKMIYRRVPVVIITIGEFFVRKDAVRRFEIFVFGVKIAFL